MMSVKHGDTTTARSPEAVRQGMRDLDFETIEAGVGVELGVSRWLRVEQRHVIQFGDATFDPDPMHVDAEWAARHSPFGGAILFGFQTMSLLTWMLHDVLSEGRGSYESAGLGLNYGFDHVRLISPVPVGSDVRGRFALADFRRRDDTSCIQTFDVEIELRDADKPALVGRWLALWASKQRNNLAG